MNAGDTVKFKKETPEESVARESGSVVMKVLWVDSPRVGVVAEIGENINPTYVYSIDELEVVSS